MANYDPAILTYIEKGQYQKIWPFFTDYDNHDSPESAWSHLPAIFIASLKTQDEEFIRKIITRLHKKEYFVEIEKQIKPLELAIDVRIMYIRRKKEIQLDLNRDIYHTCMFKPTVENVQNELNLGANINTCNNGGTSLSMLALENNALEVFQFMLDFKGLPLSPEVLDINFCDYEKTHLISHAADNHLKSKKKKLHTGPTGLDILLNHYAHDEEQIKLFHTQLAERLRNKAEVIEVFKTYLEKIEIRKDLDIIAPLNSLENSTSKHTSIHKI